MYRIAVQWLLGVHLEGNRLTIRPCVPSTWTRYTVRLRRKQTLYEIVVEPGVELVVEVDGVAVSHEGIDLADDGQIHTVHVKHRAVDKLAG
jgi:cellobiose phosphorylase